MKTAIKSSLSHENSTDTLLFHAQSSVQNNDMIECSCFAYTNEKASLSGKNTADNGKQIMSV